MSPGDASEGTAEALCAALGGDVVALQSPDEAPPGRAPAFRASPRNAEELSQCLAWLDDRRAPVEVRGRGTRAALGNPLRDVAGVLCTERLTGVLEFDAQDGVLHVAAGTLLTDLAAEVAASGGEPGWEVPLDPPGASATVGGTLAAGATGPRRQRYGAPRRAILGLGVVLASGEHTRCGGRVVKNVTGYDMAKLYAGSLGTLGVIESAWLRLRPAPADSQSFVGMLTGQPVERVSGLGVAASRRPSVRVAALVCGAPARELGAPTDDATVLVVECAGDAAAVAADGTWLAGEAGTRGVAAEARLVGRLREQQGAGRLRARLAVLPAKLAQAVAILRDAGLGVIAYPGPGLVYAIGEAEGAGELAAVDAAVAATGADLLLEVLPDARGAGEPGGRDVFGDPGPRAPLLRSIKQRFDPGGILNPGRGQGFL